jgi:hypothetical protein
MTVQLKYAEVDNHNGAKENNNKKLGKVLLYLGFVVELAATSAGI